MLKEYIERGIKHHGTAVKLAEAMDYNVIALRNAKNGYQSLPDYACIQLAEIIGEDPLKVIAASQLVTEKNEKRIEIWERVMKMKHAAVVGFVFIMTAAIGLFALPSPAQAASVTNFVTQFSADANIYAGYSDAMRRDVCIMLNCILFVIIDLALLSFIFLPPKIKNRQKKPASDEAGFF